ncbi:MAG TPA: ParM/StbA family protein [Chloroflexaceae bacterium]|nr:ParM/StbA family protein [Chloroflexaceae bacterium]
MTQPVAIGLIVGHGYTKIQGPGGTACFPSVAALAPTNDGHLVDATLGPPRNTVVTLDDGSEWLAGATALSIAPNRLVSILDRARYGSPSFVALAREALRQVLPCPAPLRVITGMPAAWFADVGARQQLADAITKAARPWGPAHVTLAPEPAGIYYDYLFERGSLDLGRKAEQVGVFDLGYRDAGVAWFSAGRYAGGESVPGGMAESLREVKRLIAATYGLELSLHEVDTAVRRGGLTVEGERRALPPGSAEALVKGLETVAATGRSLWPNGGRGLDALVVGGGGAHVLAEPLRRAFPHAVVLSQPQLSGARGFYAMASMAAATSRGL